MGRHSEGADLAGDILKGTVVEFSLRVIVPFQGPAQLQLVHRGRSGMTVLARAFAHGRTFSVAEVDDVVTSLHGSLIQHLQVTSGVQLTLSS